MKNISITFYLLTILAAVVVIAEYHSAASGETAAKESYVHTICNASRLEYSWTDEDKCAEAQDRTNTEFLCKTNNMNPATYCWVEEK